MSLAVQFAVNGFVYATYLARLPEIRDQVGISLAALGLVLTTGALAGLVGSFFAARVIGWLGSKRVLVVGALLHVLTLPVIGSSTSPVVLVVGLVALMTMDIFVDVALGLQASATSARRARPVISRLHGLFSVGTIAGGGAAALLAAQGVSVAVHFVVVAAVLVVAVAVVAPGLLTTDQAPTGPAKGTSQGRRWPVGRAAVPLALASALAVPLDIVPGEWATFRLADDLGAGPGVAAAAFVAFTTGLVAGRFGGDAVVVGVGRERTAHLGVATAAAGLVVATLVPTQPTALVGFLLAGLGVSVVAPLLADAAARAPGPPGSGFTVLLVSNRAAGLLTPLCVGALAGGAGLSVGTAMAVVALPCAALLLAISTAAIRDR